MDEIVGAPNVSDMGQTQKEQETIPLAKEPVEFGPEQVALWRNRFKTANRLHRKQFIEKYKAAKRRYNSEIGKKKMTGGIETHQDVNFLYTDVEDFNSSVFFKNPQIDLTARETADDNANRRIENLQQIVNDEIRDDRSFKSVIRASLVDEALAGFGAVYIDTDYETEPVQDGTRKLLSDRIAVCRIRPENLIIPPFQTAYNYQDGPYLGYTELISLEDLKRSREFDQAVIEKLHGKSYPSLLDIDPDQIKNEDTEKDDGLLYIRIFVGFIRGSRGQPLKRVVLADEEGISEPLVYAPWSKPNGPDGTGFPIHILMLNDPCDGFYPPSEAWMLEPVLCLMDYLWEKMATHLKRSSTRTFVKSGKEGFKREDIVKLVAGNDLEIVALQNLAPGIDIRSLIFQLADTPLSADHIGFYDLAKRLMDEISRKPKFSQAAILNKEKTATEVSEIRAEDMSASAYKVDKFKDFMVSLLYDWAKLRQAFFYDEPKVMEVEARQTGDTEQREVSETDVQGSFSVDINVESFTAPNKEVKRRTVKETIADSVILNPMLKEQGKKLNAKRLTDEYFRNVEIRNPDELTLDTPIRDVDQQIMDLAFKGIPINISEIGGDAKKALDRTMEIFGDDLMVGTLEKLSPGISAPDGPIANLARDLEMLVKGEENTMKVSAATSRSMSDVGMNGAIMAQAQKV